MLELAGYEDLELDRSGPICHLYRGRRGAPEERVWVEVPATDPPDATAVGRLKLAWRVASRLEGERVLKHLALERAGTSLALVSEDFGGEPLDRLLERGPLPVRSALELGIAIAEAVGSCHLQGVVHNDVRPANLLVRDGACEVRLTGFGSASLLERERAELDRSEELRGALAYLAPEQTGRTNREVDHRADLYSLGATLYHALTGTPPFSADDPLELVHQHIAVRPAPPDELDPEVPAAVARVVLKLLEKEPERRYLSAFGLKADLERCVDELARKGSVQPFALGERDLSSRFLVPQVLYGREREAAELRTMLERVASGMRATDGESGVCLVSGAPGIGKTALIRELRAPTVEHRGWFCTGKFDQFRRDAPYRAIAEALRDLVRQILAESDAVLQRIREEAAAAVGDNAPLLCDLVPELTHLLGPQPPAPQLDAAIARERFDRAFQGFLGIFSRIELPLVIFLDDLQWADAPSIEVVRAVVTNPSRSHLLLVGAYRDTEVGEDHVLNVILRAFAELGVVTSQLRLDALDRESVGRLVADTLAAAPEEVARLADLAHGKTAGNPFFVGELLRSLYRDGLIRFDAERGRWSWDLEEIASVGITDNVVDLMTDRLRRLPEETQDLVQLAACVGAGFHLDVLARAWGNAGGKTARALGPALEAGLVVPVDAAYKYAALSDDDATAVGNPAYRFLHDRVQQAAHELLPETERRRRHLEIGRLLLESAGGDELEEHLLVIAEHLNQGLEFVDDPAERMAIARLDLDAGRRAKATLAFENAAQNLRAGLGLLTEEAWRTDYDLALQLHTEACEAELLTANYARVDELAATVRGEARDLMDRIRVEEQRVTAGIAQDEYVEAVRVARELLGALGVRLPARPNQAHVVAGVLKTKLSIGGRTPEKLAALPPLEDARVRAAMRLLMSATAPAYFGMPKMFPLIIFAMVRLSVRHGNSRLSAYAYTVYGMILCGALGELKAGYRFGQLGLQMLRQYGDGNLYAKICMVWNAFVRHWIEPLRESPPALLEGLDHGISHGDAEYGIYCGTLAFYYSFLNGAELGPLLEDYEAYGREVVAYRQAQSLPLFDGWRTVVENLHDPEAATTLTGPRYDVEVVLPEVLKRGNFMAVVYGSIGDALLCVFFGDDERAYEDLLRAENYLDSVLGMYLCPLHAFLTGLVAARLIAEGSAPAGARKTFQRYAKKLRKWARENPANLAHKVALLEGEAAALGGRTERAAECYARAAAGARREGFVNEEALAWERLGDLRRSRGDRTAACSAYERALGLYRQWGAHHKAAHLLRERAEWLPRETADATPLSTEGEVRVSGRALDALSAVKAARSLSGEIERGRLVTRMLGLLLENAGAERGALLFKSEEGLVLETAGRVGAPAEVPRRPIPVAERDDLPRSLLDYVARSHEAVVVDDATAHDVYGRDPYVQRARPRSLLCAPVLHNGELQGMVYIENNEVAGAFTPARCEIVEVLSGQLGVSIENARLFAEQRELTASASRFVPGEFLEILGRESITDVRLGDAVATRLSVLFSDVLGFTSRVEALGPRDSIRFVNDYLAHMEPAITGNGGFVDSYIGDAIMALFARGSDAAVRAGIQMHSALRAFNREREQGGEAALNIGVGINTGSVMLGTVGAQRRLKCGVVGDAVNLAARVESLTRTYRVGLLISGDARDDLAAPDAYDLRYVGRVQVVGRTEPATLYEVFDCDEERLRDAKRASAARYEEGLSLFYERRFPEACRVFEEVQGLLPRVDAVLASFIASCGGFIENDPGPDWIGVVELTHK